jgi:hypothetical protein
MWFTSKRPNISIEGYVGLSAAVIAITALGFSFFQNQQQQRHNQLSVAPILTFTNSRSIGAEPFVGLILSNKGVGPAITGNLHLFVDGQLVTAEDSFGGWAETLKLLCPEDYVGPLCVTLTEPTARRRLHVAWGGDVIRPGESKQIFGVREDEYDLELRNAIVDALETRLIVAVCYVSVYGERWVIHSRPLGRYLELECPILS